MKRKTINEQKRKAQKTKKSYHSPTLIVYGDIRTLTAGGAGPVAEPGKGTGQPPGKHP